MPSSRISPFPLCIPRLPLTPVAFALALVACGGEPAGPDGGATTLSGTVRSAEGPLAGATVSMGSQHAVSGADGRFDLTDTPLGAGTVRAERPGYLPAEAPITITPGANTHDFTLAPQEIYELGPVAVYLPGGVGPLRGTIVVLGGPVTSGFVTGARIAPENDPELEVSLQALGASLRALARSAHVALLGTDNTAMANSAASDAALLAALTTVSQTSGQAALASEPLLAFGLSGGSREAAGLVARHPERAIGLLERVPVQVEALASRAALDVPTLVMQAELDDVVSNDGVATIVAGNRAAGGLWALVVEPGVGHHTASARGNSAAIGWLTTVLALRLPAVPGGPPATLAESSGWLGNQSTLEIAAWGDYAGDRATASWLPSEPAAASWKQLGTPVGGSGGNVAAQRTERSAE